MTELTPPSSGEKIFSFKHIQSIHMRMNLAFERYVVAKFLISIHSQANSKENFVHQTKKDVSLGKIWQKLSDV